MKTIDIFGWRFSFTLKKASVLPEPDVFLPENKACEAVQISKAIEYKRVKELISEAVNNGKSCVQTENLSPWMKEKLEAEEFELIAVTNLGQTLQNLANSMVGQQNTEKIIVKWRR